VVWCGVEWLGREREQRHGLGVEVVVKVELKVRAIPTGSSSKCSRFETNFKGVLFLYFTTFHKLDFSII